MEIGVLDTGDFEELVYEFWRGVRRERDGGKVEEGDGRVGAGDAVDERGVGGGFIRCGCDEDNDGEGRLVGQEELAQLHHGN